MSTFSELNWACPQGLSQSCRLQVQGHSGSSSIKGSEVLYWSQNTQGGWVALSAQCKGILGRFSLDRRRGPRLSRSHTCQGQLSHRQAGWQQHPLGTDKQSSAGERSLWRQMAPKPGALWAPCSGLCSPALPCVHKNHVPACSLITELSLPLSYCLLSQPHNSWSHPLALRRKLLPANYIYSPIPPRDLFCLALTGVNSSEPVVKTGRLHPQIWVSTSPQKGIKGKTNIQTFLLTESDLLWLFLDGRLRSPPALSASWRGAVGLACQATSFFFIRKITGLATCPLGLGWFTGPCSKLRHQKNR